MKSITAFFISIMLFTVSNNEAKSQEKLLKAPHGITYSLLKTSSGKKIKLTNIVTLNLIEKTENDSVLFSSYELSSALKIRIHPSKELIDLMDVLVLLSEKDSVLIRVPADSIFKNNEDSRPAFLPKGSAVVFLVKIENVQTAEEALAEEKKALEIESQLLAQYITRHKLEPLFTTSGLLYVITKPAKTQRPKPADTVVINYTASTINGKVFDTSIEAEALKAGLQQPGRNYHPIVFVIGKANTLTAWDEGLLAMTEGSSATFIIPSELAYGATGYGKLIKPYSTLLINVDLIKIRKASSNRIAPGAKAEYTSKQINTTSGYPSTFFTGGLTSLFILLTNENKKTIKAEIPYSAGYTIPWSIRWLEIISNRLGE